MKQETEQPKEQTLSKMETTENPYDPERDPEYFGFDAGQTEVKGEESINDLIDDEFFKTLQKAIWEYKAVKHRINYMKEVTGLDSQNIMKSLNAVGFGDVATVRIHKLMFYSEALAESKAFQYLEKKRVDLVCAKYRKPVTPSPTIKEAGQERETIIAKAKREYEIGKIGFVMALEQVYNSSQTSAELSELKHQYATNQHRLSDLQIERDMLRTELSELKSENERLENALFALWKHTPDLENEPDNGNDFAHAIKQAHELIKHRLTPINHER